MVLSLKEAKVKSRGKKIKRAQNSLFYCPVIVQSMGRSSAKIKCGERIESGEFIVAGKLEKYPQDAPLFGFNSSLGIYLRFF